MWRTMESTQLVRGVLDLAVLAVLSRGDAYGYDVLRRLRDAGLRDIGDASVYGTLRRLYRGGALSSYVVPSDEGPNRKYYALTPAGRDQLEASRKVWDAFVDDMAMILDGILDGSHTQR